MPPPRLTALAHPEFRVYLGGGFVSSVGNQVQSWAIAWHVWQLTGSSLYVGLLGLVRVFPLLLFSLFGGVLADELDRRRLLLATQGWMAAISLAIALVELNHASTVALLYVFVSLLSVARAFDGPTRQALVANLVPARDLPNAISLNGISWRLSDVLGPVIAGVLISTGASGLAWCYLLNVISFGAMIAAVSRLSPKPPQFLNDDRVRTFGQAIASIKEGLSFVSRSPVVRSAMWIDFWATFFSSADALLPAFAEKILRAGPKEFGVLAGSAAAGAMAAAAVLAWLPPIRHQGRWVIGMIAAYGLCTIGFGLSTSILGATFFLAGTGAADMVSTVLRQTIRQLATPDHLRGRMTGTSMIFHISGPQLGDAESGILARFTGERLSIILGGAACMLVAGNWMRGPSLRDYQHEDG